jgi:drug/metabolite transporter (DMT)-like permease
MQAGPFVLLLFAFGFMLLFIQRTEPKRRLIVALGMGVIGIVIVRYVAFRDFHAEAQTAFVVAAILNFLFWAIIGRYNPPKNSDDMKVLGLDD